MVITETPPPSRTAAASAPVAPGDCIFPAIDQAREAILIRNLQHRITYWNAGATALFGWSAREAIGCDSRSLIRGEEAGYEEAMAELMQRGHWSGELPATDRYGQPLVLERCWSLVRGAKGAPVAVLSIITDVSARRRVQAALQRLNVELEERVRQRTGQLEAARRELEALSCAVSHDLRPPLAAIAGVAAGLEGAGSPPLDERSQQAVLRIRATVRRMEALIDELLDHSKLSRASWPVLEAEHH